jgi:hypothetical protein
MVTSERVNTDGFHCNSLNKNNTNSYNYHEDEISGSHGGKYEDDCLPGWCAM